MSLRSAVIILSASAALLSLTTLALAEEANSTSGAFQGSFVEEGIETEENWIELGNDDPEIAGSETIKDKDHNLLHAYGDETPASSDDSSGDVSKPMPLLRGSEKDPKSPDASTSQMLTQKGNLVNLLDTSTGKEAKGTDTKTTQQGDESSRRIVVMCDPNESIKECVDRLNALPGVKIIHKLEKLHRVAIAVKGGSALDDVVALGMEVHDDPIREPLGIPESIVLHHRKLNHNGNQEIPYGVTMVKATDVWEEFGAKGQGVRVCVMDSGISRSHPDFVADNLFGYSGYYAGVPQWYSDSSGHGTHVAGTIAAADNSRGVIGVAPEAEIYTVRVFDQNGNFYGSDVVAAADACRDAGADIINMSLGGPQYDRDEKEIFEELYNEGILAVAASGNSGQTDFGYPASYEIVMSVGAVDSSRRLAYFSTRNNRVDISAPGVGVLSTYLNGGYATQSGTSMSTPHVAGVAALLKSINPSISASDLMQVMIDTSDDAGRNGYDTGYGHGIVNALSAARRLGSGGGGSSPTRPPVPSPTQAPVASPVTVRINFRTDGYAYETSYYLRRQSDGNRLWDVDGRELRNFQSYYQQSTVNPGDCYRFEIFDSYGDGIFGTGIELLWDGERIYQGGNFGYGGYIDLGEC